MAIIRLKDHPDAFVTPQEVADFMKVSVRHIQRDIVKGALPARKVGRAWRILITDAQAYVGSTEPDNPKK